MHVEQIKNCKKTLIDALYEALNWRTYAVFADKTF
jgi:hypothetical protein